MATPLDIGNIAIKALRVGSIHLPIRPIRTVIKRAIQVLTGGFPKDAIITSHLGHKFKGSIRDGFYRRIFLKGYHEPYETEVLRKIIHKGNVTLDIGANIGWFTIVLSDLVGENGRVYSFEPVPKTFEMLTVNCALNAFTKNVHINNYVMGNKDGVAEMNTFENRAPGGFSLSARGKANPIKVECKMTSVDSYIKRMDIKKVDFIKCDVEGAEMLVLEGANNVLSSPQPPIWLIELNNRTAKHFSHTSKDILQHLASKGYEFYHIVKYIKGKLRTFLDLDDYVKGNHHENALAIIPKLHQKRIDGLVIS